MAVSVRCERLFRTSDYPVRLNVNSRLGYLQDGSQAQVGGSGGMDTKRARSFCAGAHNFSKEKPGAQTESMHAPDRRGVAPGSAAPQLRPDRSERRHQPRQRPQLSQARTAGGLELASI